MKKIIIGLVVFLFVIILIGCGEKREERETKYLNGQSKEQYYVIKDQQGNYVKDGLYILWSINGQKKAEGNYKNGKTDGIYTTWFINGQKEAESNFKDGKLDGKLIIWNNKGQKKWEIRYKDGEVDTEKYLE